MGVKGISKRAPIGKRFGRLVVKSAPIQRAAHANSVMCRCDCSDVREYFIGNLVKQAEPMCPACRQITRPAKGQSRHHPLFNIWKAMIQRCENPKHDHYADYGGRGIMVCDMWRNDFLAFARDVGERPDLSLTLDRIDGAKGYEPGNVRWATHTQQMNNRSMNVHITWRGRSLTIAEAAREAGLGPATLTWRIRQGWDMDKAMTKPVRGASHA